MNYFRRRDRTGSASVVKQLRQRRRFSGAQLLLLFILFCLLGALNSRLGLDKYSPLVSFVAPIEVAIVALQILASSRLLRPLRQDAPIAPPQSQSKATSTAKAQGIDDQQQSKLAEQSSDAKASDPLPEEAQQKAFEEKVLDDYIRALAKEWHYQHKNELAKQINDFLEDHADFFKQPEQIQKLLPMYDQAIQAASQGREGREDYARYYGDARDIFIKRKAEILGSFERYQAVLDLYVQSLAREPQNVNKRGLAEQLSTFIEEHTLFFDEPEQVTKLLVTLDQAIEAASQGPEMEALYYGDARSFLFKQKARCLKLQHSYRRQRKDDVLQ